jgi:FAD:protein FMN transferase
MIARMRPLLGTLVEIRHHHAADEQTVQAVEAAFAAVAKVQSLMSFHDPASELSRLNREAHRATQQVHGWTHRVLATALELHRASAGRFDLAIAPQLVRRGLLPAPIGPEPDRHATCNDVELGPCGQVRFRRPLWLDLGGIAKGFAVDAAVAVLRARGVRSGAVNAGGDLRVFGAAAQPLMLRDTTQPDRLVQAGLLRNGACASSAGYYHAEDEWALVDPVSGRSPRGGGISVIAPRCLWADALTKVVALDEKAAQPLLARYGASMMRT